MHKFYIYPGNNSHLIKEALLRRGNWQEDTADPNPFMSCNFVWKPTNLTINEYIKLDGISKGHPKNFHQIFNHFENIRGICTKTGLIRSLKSYYNSNLEARQANYKVFDTTPTSFLITAGVEDQEYSAFVARYRDIVKQSLQKESIPQKHCEANMWLVKPANLNQGRGIEVFKNLKDINNFLSSKPRNSFWVVQKYIEKPLLYLKRKFDIRVWVVVTEKHEIFIYKKAYIRTSSDGYDIKASDNYIHLTNNCLQKFGENYGKHEDGNTLPLESLDEHLKTEFPEHNIQIETHVMPRIKDLIIDTILCTKKNLNCANRKGVFELFGYDFLIDEDMRTWLIEINTNPYLGIPNKYIAKILPEMLDDMLEIVLDPVFPAKTRPRSASRPNDYQLIYCENGSIHHNGPLNVRSPFTRNVYPVQSLVPPDFWKKNLTLADKNQEGAHQTYYHETIPVHTTKNNSNTQSKTEDSPDARKRASSAEQKGAIVKDYGKSNIEATYKQLCLMMIYKTDTNSNFITNQAGRVLSCLKNWELLSNREIKIACKTLTLIAHSSGGCILAEQANIMVLAKLLKSSDVKTEIKFAVIETINILSKDINLKKRLICNHLLHNLISLCLASCDEKEIQNHDKSFLIATLKCLINLGGIFNRKNYIPGETRDASKLRSFFIAQGGIAAIWIISQKSLDKDMKEYCNKHFLNWLEISDWERQLQMLELLSNMPKGSRLAPTPRITDIKNELATSLNNPDQEETKKQGKKEEGTLKIETDAIFYRTSEIMVVEKALVTKADPSDKELEKIIDFPRNILRIFSLEAFKKEFMEYVNKWREAWEKRESDEKEKKILMENERVKKIESKKKELEEQRKQALENFEKRIKMNLRKQQLDIERRQKELEELKQRELQERKRNIENMMNKRVEREKKQLRIRSFKHTMKRTKDEDYVEETYDKNNMKVSRVVNLKTQKSIDFTKSEKDRISLKQLGNMTLKHESNKADFSHNEITMNKRESHSVEPLRDVSGAGTNKIGQTKEEREHQEPLMRDSHKSSPRQEEKLKENAIGENDENRVNQENESNLKHDPRAQLFSEADAVSRKVDSEKDNSASNCKLPKLQKAGRLLFSQKLANSPYLKSLDETAHKSKSRKNPHKDTSKIRKDLESSLNASPNKGRALAL